MAYDVITFGETMLRLSPPDHRRIEQTSTFEIEVGGSESNVAIGLSRLGYSVAWLSRLPDSALGRLIVSRIAEHGVHVSHVVWASEGRAGIYFLEEARAPRSSTVIYDRENTTISEMTPEELPTYLFEPGTARLLHLSGITPALGPNAAATAMHALNLAREAGWQVSFDVNFRSKLWSSDAAREGCAPFIERADLIFAPLRDVKAFYHLDPAASPEEALIFLRRANSHATLVVTMGADGAMGQDAAGDPVHQPSFPVEPVSRPGTGDAFVAGYLSQHLAGKGLYQALRWGAAMAALKYSIRGDRPYINRAEVEALVASKTQPEPKFVR